MGRWIKSRIVHGGYGNASEYFRDLVRKDQKLLSQDEIESQLLDALREGSESPLNPKDWERMRQEVRSEILRRQKAKA